MVLSCLYDSFRLFSGKKSSGPLRIQSMHAFGGGNLVDHRVGNSSFIIFSSTFFCNKRRFLLKPKFFFYVLLLFMKLIFDI